MIHTRMLTADGAWQADVPVDQLRPHVEDAKTVLWLDLDSPTIDEVGLIGTLLSWDELTVEDIAKQGQRAKLEHFDGYAYLVIQPTESGAGRGPASSVDEVMAVAPGWSTPPCPRVGTPAPASSRSGGCARGDRHT